MIREELSLSGRLTIKMVDQQGQVIGHQQNNNKIVSDGRLLVASLFKGYPITPVSFFGIGTSNLPTLDTDVGLKQEIAITSDGRKEITNAEVLEVEGTNQKKVAFQGKLDMGDAIGVRIKEVGLFNYKNVGTQAPRELMYNRVVIQEIEKTSLFELYFFWEIIF